MDSCRNILELVAYDVAMHHNATARRTHAALNSKQLDPARHSAPDNDDSASDATWSIKCNDAMTTKQYNKL